MNGVRKGTLIAILLFSLLWIQTRTQSTQIIKLASTTKSYSWSDYDDLTTDAIRTAALGSGKFGLSAWVKFPTFEMQNDNLILLMTMATSNPDPFDPTTLVDGTRHLSRILSFAMSTKSNTLQARATNFDNKGETNDIYGDFSGSSGSWIFVYTSINIDDKIYYNLVSTLSGYNYNRVPVPISSSLQEKLNGRLSIYAGGSKYTCISPNFKGDIADPTFYVNYFNDYNPQILVYQDQTKLLYFNLNTETTPIIYSYYDSLYRMTFGDVDGTLITVPTFSSDTGLRFDTTKYAKVDLLDIIPDFGLVSFWLFVNTGGSGYYDVFGIKTVSDTLFKLVFKDGNLYFGKLTFSTGGAAAPAGQWNHIIVSWAVSNEYTNKVTLTIAVNGAIFKSIIPEILEILQSPDVLPPDARNNYIYFGKVSGDAFVGNMVDLFIARGGFQQDSTTISNCKSSIGVINPYCLFCKAGFYLFNGACLSSCPSGTYFSTNPPACRLCHKSCKECQAGGPLGCTSCSAPYPLLFKGVCHSQCPKGSVFNSAGNTCTCVPTCKECSYSINTKTATCDTCVNINYYKDNNGGCVDSRECPYGQWGNSGSCSDTCINFKNYATRACTTSCSTNTIKFQAEGKSLCLLECPTGYFQRKISSALVAETDQECVACQSPCSSCTGTLSSQCLSCAPGFYFYEFNNTCANKCDKGFFLYREICRVCRDNCTDCPVNFLNYNNTCVASCPLDSIGNSTHCIMKTISTVIINQAPQDPTASLRIPRNRDLLLNVSWILRGEITGIQWQLGGINSMYGEEFFRNTFSNLSVLQIPRKNIRAGTLYNVSVDVFSAAGAGSAYILLNTSESINEGLIDLVPNKGLSGTTDFSITLAVWSAAEPLTFDIFAYQDIDVLFRSTAINTKQKLFVIRRNLNSVGTYNFRLPYTDTDTNLTIEVVAYTGSEEIRRKLNVTVLANQGNSSELKSDLWRTELTSPADINQLLDLTNKFATLYPTSIPKKIQRYQDLNSLSAARVLQNNNKEFLCNDLISCNGQGVCSSRFAADPLNGFGCACFQGYAGDTCQWAERDLQVNQNVTLKILSKINEVELNDATSVQIAAAINNMAVVDDFVSKSGIRLILNVLRKFQRFTPKQFEVYYEILSCLARVTGQTFTRTTFRADEKARFSSEVRSLLASLLQKLETKMTLGQDFLFDSVELTVYMSKKNPLEFVKPNSTVFELPLSSVMLKIPNEVLSSNESLIITATDWKIQSSLLFNNTITSSSSFTLKNNRGLININNLTEPIYIYARKLASYKPLTEFQENVGRNLYTCGYVDTNSDTVSSMGCSFVNETDQFILCKCNHATEFVAQPTAQNIKRPPTFNEIKKTNDQFLSNRIAWSMGIYRNFDSISGNFDYTRVDQPTPPPEYIYWNGGAWACLALILLYILACFVNYNNWDKNKIDTYLANNKEILLMSHHPIVSLTIHGFTTISHTQPMRLTKLFLSFYCHVCCSAIFFQALERSDPNMREGKRIVGAAFIGLVVSGTLQYLIEACYWLLKLIMCKRKRSSLLYHLWLWSWYVALFVVSVACMGRINDGERDNIYWLYTLILIFGLDLIICHSVILCWAFWTHNKGRLSKFFAFQGYFVGHTKVDLEMELENRKKHPEEPKSQKIHVINASQGQINEPENKNFIKPDKQDKAEKQEVKPEKQELTEEVAQPRNHEESFSENRSLVNNPTNKNEEPKDDDGPLKDIL